jgi:hypothetical protein
MSKFKIFPEHECKNFQKVPAVSRVFIPPVGIDDILAAFLDCGFLNMDDTNGTSKLTGLTDIGKGVIQFTRNVKTSIGPLSVRFRLFTTAWVDRTLATGPPVFVMHSYDESEKCHMVSNFRLSLEPDLISIRVIYDELVSSPVKVVVIQSRFILIHKARVWP